MSTKDLFNKSNKILTQSDVKKIQKDLESETLAREVVKSNKRVVSKVDYSNPANFSFYGSAERYYEDSYNHICNTYPYDGSEYEKKAWENDATELDLWILENDYPRHSGYIRLGSNQYVEALGGPNKQGGIAADDPEKLSKQYPIKQGKSNIWNPDLYRNSNLFIDSVIGNTVEFWCKVDQLVISQSEVITPVVVGNENGIKLQVSYDFGSEELSLAYLDDSGTGMGYDADSKIVIPGLFTEGWNHFSFSFKNGPTNLISTIYKNGQRVGVIDDANNPNPTSVSQLDTFLVINGVRAAATFNVSSTVEGLYIDEFRFWKKCRTEEEIGRYWFTNVSGGTNTDNNKYNLQNKMVDLGVYYKFNEGITGISEYDSVVLDYSGRISNARISNYESGVRFSGSAMDESGLVKDLEFKDPNIYSFSPEFISTKKKYMDIGLNHDYKSTTSIYHTMPDWLVEEDEAHSENIKKLSQVMGSYFDDAQIKIKNIPALRDKEYYSGQGHTDRPAYLVRRALESTGIAIPELFVEAEVIEEILSRGEQDIFDTKIQEIKDAIYQNIYNNITYIYKSKGTAKSFRNMIRCFGIDDELVKINMYSDGADYVLSNPTRTTAIKKKFLDFNNADRDSGMVYSKQLPGDDKTRSYIKGMPTTESTPLGMTFETQVMFPKKVSIDHPEYFSDSGTEQHIAFLGKYDQFNDSYTGVKIFDLKVVKDNLNSTTAKFKLSFIEQGTPDVERVIETPFIEDVYDNSLWNFAVRIVPSNEALGNIITGYSTNYVVELYCVQVLGDVIERVHHEYIEVTSPGTYLTDDKYLSLGALYGGGLPESSTLDEITRVKISSALFWYDNVTNEEINMHAFDASNCGRKYPSEPAYRFDSEFGGEIEVPRRDTLALHWEFSEVSTTDNSGGFVIEDLSDEILPADYSINEKAIQFSVNGDGVGIQNDSSMSFTDGSGNDLPFSISAWVKPDTAQSGQIISRRDSTFPPTQAGEYIIGHSQGRLYVILYADPVANGSASGNFTTANRVYIQQVNGVDVPALLNGDWQNICVTYDGSESFGTAQNPTGLKIYVNGVLNNDFSGRTVTNYSGMPRYNIKTVIGNADNPDSNTFEDAIADVCIFNKELSQAEVEEVYNNGAVKDMTKFTDYASIVSWWKMGDDSDSADALGIRDYVGSNHGTLENQATIIQVNSSDLPTDGTTGRYGWFTELVGKRITAAAKGFLSGDEQVVNREYVYSHKQRTPDIISQESLIQIREYDDLIFKRDSETISHFFAVEKSMYQVIDDDIINLFASIVEFNDLIGQPVNRYRMDYKLLKNFKQRYFEKINNTPSLEKYVQLYKWIDSSVGMIIQQLIPISANFADSMRTMVESHVLERNKYWTKFPTLEMSTEPPIGIIKGINELTYNWKDGNRNIKDDVSATGTIRFTSDLAADYSGFATFIRDTTDQQVILWMLNGGSYSTGDEVASGQYAVQLSGTSDAEDIADEFTQAMGIAKVNGDIRTSASYNLDTVTLVQDDPGHLGNTDIIVGYTNNSEVSDFSGGIPGSGFLWLDQRANRDDSSVTSGDSDIDENRETIRRVATRKTEGLTQVVESNGEFIEKDKPTLKTDAGQSYEGQAYVNRALARPYKLNLDISDSVHGGVNYSPTTKDPNSFIRATTRFIPGGDSIGIDSAIGDNPETYEEWKKKYNVKRSVSIAVTDTELSSIQTYDGDLIYPYYGTNYKDPAPVITGLHNDSYGDDAEIPMQGPFTEAWVGGNQHRHTPPFSLESIYFAEFSGSSSRITVSDDDSLSFTDGEGFSTSFWFNPDALNTFTGSIADFKVLISKNNEYYVLVWDNAISLYLQDSTSDSMILVYDVDFKLGHWYNVVISYNGGLTQNDASVFINGEKKSLIPGTSESLVAILPNDATDLLFGDLDGGTPGHEYDGKMRDIVIIDGSITSSEADEFYDNGPLNHSRYADFIGWWKLRGDSTSEVDSPTKNGTDANVTYVDLGEVRPELYLDDSGVLRHPHEINELLPAARYTREEVAKRPVNIRNIKTGETRIIGNYSRDYEVVQTSGRTQNNRWFTKLSDTDRAAVPTNRVPFVSGSSQSTYYPSVYLEDYALPDRRVGDGPRPTKHIFTERFSAPGDPLTLSPAFMDKEAGEYSVYNSMNFRNLEERTKWHEELYTHSDKYLGSNGYKYSDPQDDKASHHKVNRNRFVAPASNDSIESRYDNAYVSHQIPRSDLQYTFANVDEESYESYAKLNEWRMVVPDSDELSFVSGPAIRPYISFSGTGNEYAEAADSDSLSFVSDPPNNNVDAPFSASLWAKFSNDEDGILFTKVGEYKLERSTSYGFTLELKGGGTYYYDSDPSITPGDWYNVVVTYDGLSNNNSVTFYLNGVAQAGASSSGHNEMQNTTGVFAVGTDLETSMRDLVIFDKELSQGEVTELASNATSLSFSDSSSIVSWWRLASNLNDSVGSNDLSMVTGAPVFSAPTDTPFSITAKINISDQVPIIDEYVNNSGFLPLFEKADFAAGQGGEYVIYIAQNRQLAVAVGEPTGTDYAVAMFDIPSDKIYDWMDIAITYDGNQKHTGIKLYINSQEISLDPSNSETNLGFYGMSNTSRDFIVSGAAKVSDVAIFNKELSQSDVLEIFNESDLLKFSGYSDIVSWWQLKRDMSDSISSNHGTFDNLSGFYTATEPVFSENSNLPRAFASGEPVFFSGYGSDINIVDGFAEYSDYQGAGYRFLRNVENPTVVNQRSNNILSNLETLHNGTVTNMEFIEPSVQWNKPTTHYVLDSIAHDMIVTGQEIDQGEVEIRTNPITHSYVNNIEMFSNTDLSQFLSVSDNDDAFYESLNELFRRTELLYSKYIVREVIFPRHVNVGLSKSRMRTKYDSYMLFWREKMLDRVSCKEENRIGVRIKEDFYRNYGQAFSIDALDTYHVSQEATNSRASAKIVALSSDPADYYATLIAIKTLDGQSHYFRFASSGTTGTQNADGEYIINVSSVVSSEDVIDEIRSAMVSSGITPNLNIWSGGGDFDQFYSSLPEGQFRTQKYDYSTYLGTRRGLLITSSGAGGLRTMNAEISIEGRQRGVIELEGFRYGGLFYNVIGDLSYIGEKRMRGLVSNKKTRSIEKSNLISSTNSCYFSPELSLEVSYTEDRLEKMSPLHSPQLYHNPYKWNSYQESQGWINRKTLIRKPFEDTYEKWSEDVKLPAQNYSIVPEFRVSEHMDHYIIDNSGDFTAINYAYLTLRGASIDGENINDTSEDRTVTVSSLYSYSEGGSEILTYPTSSIDDTGVFNHADGLSLNNPIFSPSSSSFKIQNSIASRRILKSMDPSTSVSSINPTFPDNAAGKFNIENQEDYLVVNLDKISYLQNSRENIRVQASADNIANNPFAVSIWAQPTQDGEGSTVGLWSAGENSDSNAENPAMAVFANFSYQPDATYEPASLGLTISFSNGQSSNSTDSSSPMYGTAPSSELTVYTFLKSDGTPAKLTLNEMNHVLVQVVPPTSPDGHKNYTIKSWVNGEELYGVNILCFHPSSYAHSYLYAHSPVPIGSWDRTLNSDVPQAVFNSGSDGAPQVFPNILHSNISANLDGAWSAASGAMNNIDVISSFVIGNCDYHKSVTDHGMSKIDKFVGILDEFCVLSDIIITNDVANNLYNSGNPRNMQEFQRSSSKNSLESFTYLFTHPMIGSFNITVDADNGEYNMGGFYVDGFSKPIGSTSTYYEDVDKVPNNFLNNLGEDYSSATPSGPLLKSSGLGVMDMANFFYGKNILCLTGTRTVHTSIQSPPAAGSWRFVELDLPFNATSKVEFSVYEGRAGGVAGLVDPPEENQQEYLYFQVQPKGSSVWSTLKTITPDGVAIPDNEYYTTHSVTLPPTFYSDNGATNNDGSTVKFRWIAKAGGDTVDHWGIFDVKVSPVDSSGKDRALRILNQDLFHQPQPIGGSMPSVANTQVLPHYMRPRLGLADWDYDRQRSLSGHLTCYHRIGVPLFEQEEVYSTWDTEFFNNYAFTDTTYYYSKLSRKKEDIAAVREDREISLNVNAVKKLIPYEGFYPQDRTVQISKLFLQKVEKNILNPNTTADSEGIYREQALQSALQHFFAPGILYNSLKSGIAVDFPAFTNETGMEPVIPGSKNYIFDNINTTRQIELYNNSIVPHWYNDGGMTSSDITDASIRLSSEPVDIVSRVKDIHSFSNDASSDIARRDVSGFVITSEPTTRIPFEALLDPYKYLLRNSQSSKYSPANISSIDAAYADYEIKSKPYQYYYMAPTYYENFVNYEVDDMVVPQASIVVNEVHGGNYNNYNFPYFELDDTSNTDYRYEMAINNFLSESVAFFLQDEKLTSVSSSRQRDFLSVKKDTQYHMDVTIKKAKLFHIVNTESSLGVDIPTGGRYFGPPSKWAAVDVRESDAKICDPAYAPYTPPYFYGDVTARIKFTAPRSGQPTISEIFSNSVVEDISHDLDRTFEAANSSLIGKKDLSGAIIQQVFGDFKDTPSYKSKMPMTASFDLFGRIREPLGIYSPEGQSSASDSESDSNDKWVISPKFECPLMNYDNTPNHSDDYILRGYGITDSPRESEGSSEGDSTSYYLNPHDDTDFSSNPRTGAGLWASLGEYQSSGLTMSVRPSPSSVNTAIEDLTEIVGFKTVDKQIGMVASQKEISEAVLMIPIVSKGQSGDTVLIDGQYFVKVEAEEYQRQKRIMEQRITVFDGSEPNTAPIYVDSDGNSVYETSMTRMMQAMNKYNIPPRFNFEKYNTEPIAMYFFEFNHKLTRQDLVNIWQGVEPEIATRSDFDSRNISHRVNKHELFSQYTGRQLPENLKWLVFKVKKKAVVDYGKITKSSLDDDRYSFDFQVGRREEPDYGYNYPYDFFTMLDKVQVVAAVTDEVDPVKFYESARANPRNVPSEE